MARTIDVITTEIKTNIRTYSSLNGFLFPEDTPVAGSKVSVFNVIIFVVAAAIYTFEVMMDILKADIQAIADSAPSGNPQWIRSQMLKFQYGDVIQLDDNFRPYYPVVDTSKNIVTQCSVVSTGAVVSIKVAKGTAPSLTPLSATELNALIDYYYGTSTTEGIGFAGVAANFVNLNPDRIRIEATIYFYGQYVQATVSAAVITAIQSFLAQFQSTAFDGTIFMIRLVDSIQAVPGVSRVYLTSVKGRAASVPLGSATVIDIQGYYNTEAGYVITEDTAGNTITDTLTFTQETSV